MAMPKPRLSATVTPLSAAGVPEAKQGAAAATTGATKGQPQRSQAYSAFFKVQKNSRAGIGEDTDVDLREKSPGDRLVLLAGLGNVHAVEQLLAEHRVPIDHPGEDIDRPGTTALIQATRYGRVDMIRFLLGHGASAHKEDAHHRSVWCVLFSCLCGGVVFGCAAAAAAMQHSIVVSVIVAEWWCSERVLPCRYYMCFSITIKGFRAAKDVAEAFFEHGVEINAATLHMAAYASSSNRVLKLFLDHLGQKGPSAGSCVLPVLNTGVRRAAVHTKGGKTRTWARMEFNNLILLDDPNATVIWPDGARTPDNETALDVIVRSGTCALCRLCVDSPCT